MKLYASSKCNIDKYSNKYINNVIKSTALLNSKYLNCAALIKIIYWR